MLNLKADSLDWALAHALKYGDTDVFPIPFEYKAVQHDWHNLQSWLTGQNILDWRVRPHRNLLSPKAKYGFRVVTQLDPLDFIIFAATVKEIAPDIENSRIPVDKNLIFSYRYLPKTDGQFFAPNIGYSSFQAQTQEILNDAEVKFVAVTDIADFYSRIYHHRLENALKITTSRQSHVTAIMKLLAGWNGTETFGIPVGNAPSRMLAEITISDVDSALLVNQVKFVRFNDDYRIFAKSYTEAYRHLAFLADILFRNHGLTLQPQKTKIFHKEEFKNYFMPTPEDRELHSLQGKFDQLIAELQLEDRYSKIEYDDLEPEQQELINSLNLAEILREEINQDSELDLALVKFVLRRMGQLGDPSLVNDVLDNIEILHPAFPAIVDYLRSLKHLSSEERKEIGTKILELLENSIISELDYHKIWVLDLFTDSTEWDNEDKFCKLFNSARDEFSKRKLILAMGRSLQRHWFQSQWRSLFDYTHWPRRALLAGASCLPSDARKHLYASLESRLDPLELAVIRWAKQNPFS